MLFVALAICHVIGMRRLSGVFVPSSNNGHANESVGVFAQPSPVFFLGDSNDVIIAVEWLNKVCLFFGPCKELIAGSSFFGQ